MCAKLLEIIGIGKVQMLAPDVIFHMLTKKRNTASVADFKLFQRLIWVF